MSVDKENVVVRPTTGQQRENLKSILKPAKAESTDAFKNFRFQATKQKAGLKELDANNREISPPGHPNISDGLIKKIRKTSISGKPKEQKKIALVSAHTRQVSFKPTGSKKSTKENTFTVPVPEHTIHHDDHDMSPMDIDAPLVKIRNRLKRVPHDIVDIDAVNDPLRCSQYAQDICDYLQAVESRFTFPSNYLHNQKEVTAHMRTVLIDWIIQVQVHQELNQNTLHLCVALVDRLLVKTVVPISKLQLLGVTALLVASKYHERFPPEIAELCHLTDNTYTPEQILQMERILLTKLNFDLNIPCPAVFLDRFLMVTPCERTPLIKSMAMYFLDLSLVDVCFVHFVSSLKAAAAIYVSRELLGCEVLWDKSFSHYTKHSERDLQECARSMRKLMAMAKKSPHTGAHTKYSHSHFHGVSNHSSLMHISTHPTNLWPSGEMDSQFNNSELEMII